MKSTHILAALAATLPLSANALTITNSNSASDLANATLAANSGITIVGGSENLIGGDTQQGTYTDFDFAGGGGGDALSLDDGVYLTTGLGTFDTTTNTNNNANTSTGTGAHQPLVDLAAANGLNQSHFDSNVLSFDFTLDDPTANSVSASFLFATDEFPTQSVTDIMGVFVNGQNFAFFPNGDLVSNQSGDPNMFFNNNAVGTGNYAIEWNGLTSVFTVTGLANGGGAVNTFSLAIADTNDTIYDSSVFLTGLTAGTTSGGGGIGNPPPAVPLPAAAWMLLAGIGGLVAMRKKRKAA